MPFVPTTFPGLIIFEPTVYDDERGYFYEAFNERQFLENHILTVFVQDNQSGSHQHVIRGLHFQRPPHAQSKLVRVLAGTIIDTAVDLRIGSPTFGESFSIELSSRNRKQLFIPKGFAHGFSVISNFAEVMYKCDAYYNKESESGILYNDPQLNIDWKIAPGTEIVSEKDLMLPTFDDYAGAFNFIP